MDLPIRAIDRHRPLAEGIIGKARAAERVRPVDRHGRERHWHAHVRATDPSITEHAEGLAQGAKLDAHGDQRRWCPAWCVRMGDRQELWSCFGYRRIHRLLRRQFHRKERPHRGFRQQDIRLAAWHECEGGKAKPVFAPELERTGE